MTPEDAFTKIMKAAEKYAAACQWHEIMDDRGDCILEIAAAREDVPKTKWELEQMIKAAIFAVTEGDK
jgi:hypothetical protein